MYSLQAQKKQSSQFLKGWLLVIGGAAFWGTVGLFVQNLYEYGFKPADLASLRLIAAALILIGYSRITEPGGLKLRSWRDVLLFIGTGSISIALFNLFYFSSIGEIGMSLAVVLVYTGPGFVILFGRIWFKEPVTFIKLLSLLLMLIGVAMVSDVRPTGVDNVSIYGALLGVGAGASFALFNLIGKYAMNRYSSLTVVIYTFLFSGFTLLPFTSLPELAPVIIQPLPLMWLAGLTVFPTLLAYILYTNGLRYMEAGRASITGVSEILMAIFLGILVFGESLTLYQIAGMILVISAMLLIRR